MNTIENNKSLLTFVLYFFSFLLVLEWIYPLKVVANTGNTYLFVIFIALSFTLYLLNASFLVTFVIKTFYILFSLHHTFFKVPLLGLEWISILLKDIFKNINLLFERDWNHLTNEFRTLLFFILLWLITYLLKYWLLVRRNIFLFFVMTIVYITVLDTFTTYNSKMAILRTIIIGFVLLGMLFFQRFVNRENLKTSSKMLGKWMIPLSVMIACSTIFALIAPKASPIWPDPVPFFKSYAGNDPQKGKGKGISKVGYRLDDSQLGGPFIGDNTTVFTAISESRQYWRMETKDIYTGKGWESSVPAVRTYPAMEKISISINEAIEHNEKTSKIADITMAEPNSNLVYTYGFTNIISPEIDDRFFVKLGTEKITAFQNEDPINVKEFEVVYQIQRYSMKKMSEITGENVQIDSRYTQLPESLPKRVKDLAKDITKGKTNWYEKTKAIEAYLQSGKYTYDQKNVAIPKEKQDYVDQFLFETLRGYCDNFSTSMVTMLRSIDIPARWVKGYSSGDYQGSEGVSKNIYKVTNNNAHSWVEVFFPNVGWVPFEPTMGFRNNAIFNNDLVSSNTQAGSTDQKNEKDTGKKPKKDSALDEEANSSDGFAFSKLWEKITNYIQTHWLFSVFIILMIGLVSYFIYLKRNKWLPSVLIWKYRMKKDPETFSKAYMSLVKQLGRYGLKKENGQTLREYAKYVDNFFGTQTMRSLTELYERSIYRGQNTEIDWEENRELWENLIKKTTG
ncbi:transglutaminase TgpA family protein [Heyndrickxia sp. NPDC080065]|uniref:transglutaminase TgpA family protein n=1 Tax=Heyndrickxia sp. NPDC080065 TaxID=3390568 RepID=UPI003D046644